MDQAKIPRVEDQKEKKKKNPKKKPCKCNQMSSKLFPFVDEVVQRGDGLDDVFLLDFKAVTTVIADLDDAVHPGFARAPRL